MIFFTHPPIYLIQYSSFFCATGKKHSKILCARWPSISEVYCISLTFCVFSFFFRWKGGWACGSYCPREQEKTILGRLQTQTDRDRVPQCSCTNFTQDPCAFICWEVSSRHTNIQIEKQTSADHKYNIHTNGNILGNLYFGSTSINYNASVCCLLHVDSSTAVGLNVSDNNLVSTGIQVCGMSINTISPSYLRPRMAVMYQMSQIKYWFLGNMKQLTNITGRY